MRIPMQFETYLSLDKPFKIPLEWLNSHLLITGINDEYGQSLLRRMAREIYFNHRDVSVLYLNTLDSRMKYQYFWDEYYYPPQCNPLTPYFYGSTVDEDNIQRNIWVLCAALGFSDDFTEKFSRYLLGKKLPPFLSQLFAQYETHVLTTKEILGEDYLLLSAIRYTIKRSFDTHWKLTSNKIPWVETLRHGKRVFIDYSKPVSYKGWYTTMVLQTLRSQLCTGKSPSRKILVIVENAHHCFHPIDVSHRSDYYFSKFLKGLLRECARNNIYFFLEERCPSQFANSIYPEIQRKAFFYHHYCNLREFPLSQEEHKTIEVKLGQGEAAVYSF
jgi:hypothetical protein